MPPQHPLQLERPSANTTRKPLHLTVHKHPVFLQITVGGEPSAALVTRVAQWLVGADVLLQTGPVQEAFGAVRTRLQLQGVLLVPVLVQGETGAEAAVAEDAVEGPRLVWRSDGGRAGSGPAPGTPGDGRRRRQFCRLQSGSRQALKTGQTA